MTPYSLCELQSVVLAAEPALAQAIKWGNLLFLHCGSHAIAIVAHKAHANLQIFNGALLAARFAQLEGSGKGMRHLKCRYREAVETLIVKACVQAMA